MDSKYLEDCVDIDRHICPFLRDQSNITQDLFLMLQETLADSVHLGHLRADRVTALGSQG